MTTSAARTISSVQGLGTSVPMSIPASAIASTATGLTVLAGSEPPEKTSTWSPARCSSQAAAIWERPALCTHRNTTLGLSLLKSSTIGTVAPFVISSLGEDAICWIEQPDQPVGDGGSDELHQDEHRRRRRLDAGERVGQGAGDRDGGVGKARRRREPVGAADPDPDRERDDTGATAAHTAVNDEQQSDGGDDLGQPERGRRACLRRELDGGQLEHEVRRHGAEATAGDLGG